MGYVSEVSRQLYDYSPALTKKEDFDQFWSDTLRQAKSVPLQAAKQQIDYPSPLVSVYDISYCGMDETRINGWFIVPSFLGKDNYPCIIHYHGFTGSRGTPSNFMHWITMGFAVLSIDVRDQGGSTGDSAVYTSGHMTNVICKGVHNKDEYYFRHAYMDCLKAIDFACQQPEVDPARIVIEGGSQGGALGMAVCALDDRPVLALVDVPSNSNIVSRVEGNHGAFASVTDYLKRHPEQTDLVFDNLSYFDTMNMADRIKCRVFASAALKDEICPALMYFATYNRITSEKEIVLYPFNGHEGGGSGHLEKKLAFVREHYSEWFE
ncbi:acetylxylan esterase [Paenibacillus sp. YIM B09110]|uniref:acetylxylan esterase n=1 Tax=Paenibacillus sp. YIM B09110 TaxID=3126102 RepID=UPI00301DEB7E